MTLFRLQAVLPYTSNLPEDVATNTIYVDAGSDLALVTAMNAFRDFYITEADTENSVGTYLSEIISRSAGACSIRAYDMTAAPPRPIYDEISFTMSGSGGFSLPYEVALVHSFRGNPPNTPSRRGRNYIGPLNANALTEAEVPVPNPGFVQALVANAEALFDDLVANETPWQVFSPTTSTTTDVTNGWVDNDFDTQRRRGKKPSSRVPWPNPA